MDKAVAGRPGKPVTLEQAVRMTGNGLMAAAAAGRFAGSVDMGTEARGDG